MKRSFAMSTLALGLCLIPATAFSLPRDAEAVLNRCGKPLKGDETILENTVAGGRRILSYERGTLNFNKDGGTGWTFTYGSHRKSDHLDAGSMSRYMPCLKDALADSASAEPLKHITSLERAETSLKRSYQMLVVSALGLVAAFGILLLLLSRRPKNQEGVVG